MKITFLITTINGFLVVALGAFGAHGLEGMVSPERLETWNTAVQYQMFHTTALFATALLQLHYPNRKQLMISVWLFLAGILLFSGSLYLLVATDISRLGVITPLGGVAFLAGWAFLFYGTVVASND